jgi:hypothetical protein
MQRNVMPQKYNPGPPLTVVEQAKFVTAITEMFNVEERKNISHAFRNAAEHGWFGYGRF